MSGLAYHLPRMGKLFLFSVGVGAACEVVMCKTGFYDIAIRNERQRIMEQREEEEEFRRQLQAAKAKLASGSGGIKL
jgi:hypothetical protein